MYSPPNTVKTQHSRTIVSATLGDLRDRVVVSVVRIGAVGRVLGLPVEVHNGTIRETPLRVFLEGLTINHL